MSEMTIEQFCNRHNAGTEVREWALFTGLTTMRDLWQREDMLPEWREWIALRPGVLTDRELRLYACWCVRKVWHLLTDERSMTVVEVAERHADGLATDAELAAAREAARAAARAEKRLVKRSAVWAAAWVAERSARMGAIWAATESAWADEWLVAWAAQSRYLLENTRPDFTAKEGGR